MQLKFLNANEQSSVLKPVSYVNAGSEAEQKSQRDRKSNITLQKIALETPSHRVKNKSMQNSENNFFFYAEKKTKNVQWICA